MEKIQEQKEMVELPEQQMNATEKYFHRNTAACQ